MFQLLCFMGKGFAWSLIFVIDSTNYVWKSSFNVHEGFTEPPALSLFQVECETFSINFEYFQNYCASIEVTGNNIYPHLL